MTPDIIGLIPDIAATYDEHGLELTPPSYLPGWHVNFPAEVPEIEQYKVDPQPVTPYRTYFGHAPVCYVFPDEATFRLHFPEPVDE